MNKSIASKDSTATPEYVEGYTEYQLHTPRMTSTVGKVDPCPYPMHVSDSRRGITSCRG